MIDLKFRLAYLLRYLKGRYHGNQFLWQNRKLPSFVVLALRNGMDYCYLNVRINSVNDASISYKNFVNQIWSSNSRVDRAHLYDRSKLAYPAEYLWIYWTEFRNLHNNYENALRADDGSEPPFPICRGSLP